MGKALLFCTIAMIFYGLEISVADWKLSKVSPRVLTLCYSLAVAVFAGLSLVFARGQVGPAGSEWTFVGLMVLASFVATVGHFAALNEGAGAVVLAMFYCLLPVVASLFAAVFKGEAPSLRLVLAWLAAVTSLVLVTGSKANE
jgi:drug/metabolite transporter (DMT)-like permease